MKSESRGTRAGFLAESEVNAPNDFALLVKIFERLFHFSVEEHPAVDLDVLLLAQVFRFADRRYRGVQVPFDLVANFIPFANLADREAGFFEAVVGNGVGAVFRKLSFRRRAVAVRS